MDWLSKLQVGSDVIVHFGKFNMSQIARVSKFKGNLMLIVNGAGLRGWFRRSHGVSIKRKDKPSYLSIATEQTKQDCIDETVKQTYTDDIIKILFAENNNNYKRIPKENIKKAYALLKYN